MAYRFYNSGYSYDIRPSNYPVQTGEKLYQNYPDTPTLQTDFPGYVAPIAVAAASYATTTALQALANLMPVAATTAPPPVAASSAVGTPSTTYSLSDHTHQSSVQAAILTVASGSTGSWTFPKAFASGVVPVISIMAENTDTAQPLIVNVSSITNTTVNFRLFKQQAPVVSLLGAAVNVNGGAVPANAKVHIWARMPT